MTPSYRRIPYRPDDEDFVRTPEVGRRLGIRTRQVYELIDEGVLRVAIDDRGLLRVPASDIDDYLRRRSA
jgi:excisionase family DNA binding protein